MRHLWSLPLPILIAIAVAVLILVLAVVLRRQPKRPPVRFGGGTPSHPEDQFRPRQRPNQQ